MKIPKDTDRVVPLREQEQIRFPLFRLDQLPERPHRDEIVSGLIAAGELVALTGAPGVGKTAVLARMSIDVAEGQRFFGRDTARGPVIYVAAEKSGEALRRLLAIRKVTKAPVYILQARPNVANKADIAALTLEIEKVCEVEGRCPALIVFDTLARVMPEINEDRAMDAGLVIAGLTTLIEHFPTAAVVFAHHVVKRSNTMRGSSALLAGVDICINVEEGKSQRRLLSVEKANSVPDDQRIAFDLIETEYRETYDAEPEKVIAATSVHKPNEWDDSIPEELFEPPVLNFPPQTIEIMDAIRRLAPIQREALRTRLRQDNILTGNPSASRMQLNRALDRLTDAGLIAMSGAEMISCR